MVHIKDVTGLGSFQNFLNFTGCAVLLIEHPTYCLNDRQSNHIQGIYSLCNILGFKFQTSKFNGCSNKIHDNYSFNV